MFWKIASLRKLRFVPDMVHSTHWCLLLPAGSVMGVTASAIGLTPGGGGLPAAIGPTSRLAWTGVFWPLPSTYAHSESLKFTWFGSPPTDPQFAIRNVALRFCAGTFALE